MNNIFTRWNRRPCVNDYGQGPWVILKNKLYKDYANDYILKGIFFDNSWQL